jgi:hypothetical protein
MTETAEAASTIRTPSTTNKPYSIGQIDVSKLTDFEISLLILERDVSQYRVERYDELLNRIGEAKGFVEAEKPTAYVLEETFTINKFEPAKGERLGEFEIAHKNNNLPDKWSHAFNVLRQNNATINNRYHGSTYVYAYWLYGEDRIYRQKLKR